MTNSGFTPQGWIKACETVERMTDDAVYIARDTIASMVHRADSDYRDYVDQPDCRYHASVARDVRDRLTDRLTKVTHP